MIVVWRRLAKIHCLDQLVNLLLLREGEGEVNWSEMKNTRNLVSEVRTGKSSLPHTVTREGKSKGLRNILFY